MKILPIVILFSLLFVPIASAEQPGHAYVTVRCMHNLFSYEMTLVSFTNNAAMPAYLTGDGKWDEDLVVGDYALILIDGNTGHREYRFFTVRPGETTYIDQFIGHAVTLSRIVPQPTIIPKPTITIIPTQVPTTIPTPVPTQICHEEKSCTPGYWGPWIPGLWINTWHPPVCTIVVICEDDS